MAVLRPISGRVGVVADDVTGALECGAILAHAGLRCWVSTGLPPDGKALGWISGASAAVLNTATRSACSSVAEQRVRVATAWLKSHGCGFVYKKIDSALRGHPGFEIRAFMESIGSANCIVAGSHPRFDRLWADNVVLIAGRTASDEPHWQIESHWESSRQATIDALVTRGLGRSWVRVRSQELRNLSATRDALRRMRTRAEVVVCEAESEEQLRHVGIAGVGLGYSLAGSAGLFEQLFMRPNSPHYVGRVNGGCIDDGRKCDHSGRRCIVVVGSRSGKSEKQKRLLVHALRTKRIRIGALPCGPGRPFAGAAARNEEAAIVQALGSGLIVVIEPGGEQPAPRGVGRGAYGAKSWLKHAGLLLRSLTKAGTVDAVVIVGGETAQSICADMGLRSLLPSYAADGIVYSRSPDAPGLVIATKAGGIGTLGVLRDAVRLLRDREGDF